MSKIVYLLGAGASIGAIPSANSTAESMSDIAYRVQRELNSTGVVTKIYHPFVKDLIEFSKEASKHRTVDTYAKKLFARGEKEKFKHLKCILSSYFALQQLSNAGTCDSRYDGFWASIIQNSYTDLPNDIKILTWNYDMQMELSFAEFCDEQSLALSKKTLNVFTNSQDYSGKSLENKFSVFKLNGTANITNQYKDHEAFDEVFLVDDYRDGLTKNNIEKVLNIYNSLLDSSKRQNTSLSFAWECPLEHSFQQRSLVLDLKDAIKSCKTLVIIGYSFPFFNRPIDKMLFSEIYNLENVYIQDTNPLPVIESFKSIRARTKSVHTIEYLTDQFFLPPEL